LKVEPISCPETSATNYQSTLHKVAEEQRHHCNLFTQWLLFRHSLILRVIPQLVSAAGCYTPCIMKKCF
jgi:hypothetical protein